MFATSLFALAWFWVIRLGYACPLDAKDEDTTFFTLVGIAPAVLQDVGWVKFYYYFLSRLSQNVHRRKKHLIKKKERIYGILFCFPFKTSHVYDGLR